MNKSKVAKAQADDNAKYQAQVDHYIKKMKRLQQQMAEDRAEVQTLQDETRIILATVMDSLQAVQLCSKD